MVDLFGSGFTSDTIIRFAGTVAGDLTVVSSGHIRVRAPSGSFGFAQVSAESELFEGEVSLSPVDYFYASNPTGFVDLEDDKPSPVSSVYLGEQIVYAVTGGNY